MTSLPAADRPSDGPDPGFAATPAPVFPHVPCNIEAEQALIGCILYDNAAYERLTDKMSAKHFYEPFHQRLFQAMEEFIRKGQLAEPIVLQERFRRDPAFTEMGGLATSPI